MIGGPASGMTSEELRRDGIDLMAGILVAMGFPPTTLGTRRISPRRQGCRCRPFNAWKSMVSSGAPSEMPRRLGKLWKTPGSSSFRRMAAGRASA